MIQQLRKLLKPWYEGSDLCGLYIVGSYSLNEENTKSDIDILGISKIELSPEYIVEMRVQIRHVLMKDIIPEKIGFRVRNMNDLETFQYKAKSWGYDLHEAKKLFGINLKSIVKPTKMVLISQKEVFDNLIEKEWYDLLFINMETDLIKKNYLCAKAILILTNFILYYNGIFLKKDISRVEYIKKNNKIIEDLPITIVKIEEALRVKMNPDAFKFDLGLEETRYKLLKETYYKLFPSFKLMEAQYGIFEYWTYSSKYFRPITKIYDELFLQNENKLRENGQNDFFLWRVILIEIFIKLDNSCRHENLYAFINRLKDILFIKENQDVEIIANDSTYSLLCYLEKIRIETSIIGNDFRKKYT